MRKFPLILLIFLLLIFFQNISAQRKSIKKSLIINCGVCNQKAIYLPKPEFPNAAKSVRASGKVEVQILIDEKGNVESVKTISGHPLLRASAEKAALQAKFEPFKLSGKSVKVIGTIIYNFISDELKEQKNEFIETIPLGVLNDKALKIWFLKNEVGNIRLDEEIQVQVTINLQEGKVVFAKAVWLSKFKNLAEMSALQTTFQPILTEFPTIYGTGILIFKTGDFTGKIVENKNPKPFPLVDGGILNSKATYFPKPKYPKEAQKLCSKGKVEVLALVELITGKVLFVETISGDELLRKSAEDAAIKVKFSPFDRLGNIFVKGRIIYNFVPEKSCKNK